MPTIDSASSTCSVKSIQTVDLRHLSQSELHALSLCSDNTLNPRFYDDVIIPKIDRSVFNESAGSRKQTYSRLRLAPASSFSPTAAAATIHRRTPHLRNSRHPPEAAIENDPERAENSRIIHLLKELFAKETSNGPNGNNFVPVTIEYNNAPPEFSNVEINVQKRKRGRPRKDRNAMLVPVPVKVQGGFDTIKDIFYNENVEERNVDIGQDKDIVNKNGVAVDLVALGDLLDPYGPELRRRTEGMTTAEELLGFLSGLNGQWGSRRKKRMVVDANIFGHVLPSNWKLLLSLKRKDGHVWLICRRYISPAGRQFVSCKDISSYLLSICGPQNIGQRNCGESNNYIVHENDIKEAADRTFKVDYEKENVVCPSLSPSTSANSSNDHVGVHSENDVKSNETSILENGRQSVEPPVSAIVTRCELLIQEPIETESSVKGICDASDSIDKLSSDKFDHDLNCLPCDKHDARPNENQQRLDEDSGGKDTHCTMNIDEICVVVDDEALDDRPIATEHNEQHCVESTETVVSVNAEDQNKEMVLDDTHVTIIKEQLIAIDHINHLTDTFMVEPEDKTCGTEENLNVVSTASASLKVNDIYNFENTECGSYVGSEIDAVNSLEEENTFEKSHLLSPWNEQVNVIENFRNEVSTCSVEEPSEQKDSEAGLISEKHFQSSSLWSEQVQVIGNYGNKVGEPTQQKKTEASLISLFDYEQNCCVEDYVDEVSTKTMEEVKFADVGNNGLNANNASFACSKEKNLEFSSLVPSEIEQSFGGVADNMNKAYSNTGNHGLSLAFGDLHSGIYPDTTGVDQPFAVEANLTGAINNLVQDPKHDRGSVGGLFNLSFNGEACGFENNLDSVYGVANAGSSNKFMMGFDPNGYGQSDGGVWRTGEGNMLQSGLSDTSNALLQPSSSFCTFDIMPDKVAQDGLFRLNEKYESQSGFEGMRPGRSEPVEFSFLTAQNTNSHQRDNSKSFSYDTRMDSEFDSSFWLGRDALMPNIGGDSSSSRRSQIATICVWCRNQFHQDPVNFGTQVALGPVCPTCRARMSGL